MDDTFDDAFVLRFRPRIRAKARQLLWTPSQVEDACQETILRVLRYFHSGKHLDNPNSLTAFVYSVCHNVAQEMNRAVSRQLPETWEAPDRAADPHDMAVAAERKRLVWEVLARLPENDRELLRQAMLLEVDKAVLCRRFGVTEDYLRVLLYRARKRFHKELMQLQGAPHAAAPAPPAFDQRYLAALRRGDPEAEAHFLAHFRGPIRTMARRRLRSLELVETVRQETFTRLLQYLRDGQGPEDPADLPAFVRTLCNQVILEVNHRS